MIKNLFIFKLKNSDGIPQSQDEMSEKLSKTKLEGTDSSSFAERSGWYEVIQSEIFAEKIQNSFLMKLRIEKKSVPSKLLSEKVDQYILDYEERTGEKIKRKQAKEEVQQTMLAKALPNISYCSGYIDLDNQYLIIDTSSQKTAELFAKKLKQLFTDFEIGAPSENPSVFIEKIESAIKTNTNLDLGHNFGIGQSAKLKCEETTANIAINNEEDLFHSSQLNEYLKEGKTLEMIEVNWMNRYQFKINKELKITSIKTSEEVNDLINESKGESDDEISAALSSYNILIYDFKEMVKEVLEITSEK